MTTYDDEVVYLDANDREIKTGDRVQYAGWPWEGISIADHPVLAPDNSPLTEFQACGEILRIDDPDGDVDDEGRSIMIPPYVVIRFDDGTEERFSGWLKSHYPDFAEFLFDDIEVVE